MDNGQFLKAMGSKIKANRKANKLTLKKLGELTGLHLTSLWFIENGKQDIHILNLKKIADALGRDIRYFI